MSRHWDPRTGGWKPRAPAPGNRRPRRRPRGRLLGFRMEELRLALLAGVAIGLAAVYRPPALPVASAAAVKAAPGATVRSAVRVIDGDTFDHDGERIRIADIDTPELRSRCQDEQLLARAATDRLRTLLADGPFELVRLGRDEDRYGRKLRIVVRDGRSLGDTLVAEGLARTWTGRREPWC